MHFMWREVECWQGLPWQLSILVETSVCEQSYMCNKCLSLICVFAYYETNGIYMADSFVKREYWLMFYHFTTELMSSYVLPDINTL